MPTLRKRANEIDYSDNKENRPENAPLKRAKKAAPEKKTASEKKAAPEKKAASETKRTNASAPAGKNGTAATKKTQTSDKVYKTTVGAVDKEYKVLEKMIKPNGAGVSSDTFASEMASFLPTVKQLLETPSDSARHAFNLLMYLGENSYSEADLNYTAKFCGCGPDGAYTRMDELMLKVIDARVEADKASDVADDASDPAFVPEREEADELAELESYLDSKKSKRPNKSEYNQLMKLRRAAFREEVQNARHRRETVKDWKANALEDMQKVRKFLKGFGLDKKYFQESMGKLEQLTGSVE